jgi:hypothetical protein
MAVGSGREEGFRRRSSQGEYDAKTQRFGLSPLSGGENEAFSKRKQMFERKMPGGKETLPPRGTRKSKEKNPGIWASAQGEAEAEKILWYVRETVSALFPESGEKKRHHRRKSPGHAGEKAG